MVKKQKSNQCTQIASSTEQRCLLHVLSGTKFCRIHQIKKISRKKQERKTPSIKKVTRNKQKTKPPSLKKLTTTRNKLLTHGNAFEESKIEHIIKQVKEEANEYKSKQSTVSNELKPFILGPINMIYYNCDFGNGKITKIWMFGDIHDLPENQKLMKTKEESSSMFDLFNYLSRFHPLYLIIENTLERENFMRKHYFLHPKYEKLLFISRLTSDVDKYKNNNITVDFNYPRAKYEFTKNDTLTIPIIKGLLNNVLLLNQYDYYNESEMFKLDPEDFLGPFDFFLNQFNEESEKELIQLPSTLETQQKFINDTFIQCKINSERVPLRLRSKYEEIVLHPIREKILDFLNFEQNRAVFSLIMYIIYTYYRPEERNKKITLAYEYISYITQFLNFLSDTDNNIQDASIFVSIITNIDKYDHFCAFIGGNHLFITEKIFKKLGFKRMYSFEGNRKSLKAKGQENINRFIPTTELTDALKDFTK